MLARNIIPYSLLTEVSSPFISSIVKLYTKGPCKIRPGSIAGAPRVSSLSVMWYAPSLKAYIIEPTAIRGQLWIFVLRGSDTMIFAAAVADACAAIVAPTSGVLTIIKAVGVFELE